MIKEEIHKKIKTIEIQTRHIVDSMFSGEYHSVFKGQGINFADIRKYQIGDDFRRIDWKNSAKTNEPHIKLCEEEREINVIMAVDISGSTFFGSKDQSKVQVAAEIAAVLGFSAMKNKDRVGLLLFSEHIEKYIPPNKGQKHIFRILREIYGHIPQGKQTNIGAAMDFIMKTNKKRSIVFVISDFIDETYHKPLLVARKKHDIIPIMIEDPIEKKWQNFGRICFEDSETGQQHWLNTEKKEIRDKFQNIKLAKKNEITRFFSTINCTAIHIDITKSYIKPLQIFFEARMKQKPHH